MAYHVTLIPGDGSGPEIVESTKRVLEATKVVFSWDVVYAGAEVLDRFGTPLPHNVLESNRKNKVALKEPVTTPIGSGFRSVNVALRKELDLYVCLRPCKPSRAHSIPASRDSHAARWLPSFSPKVRQVRPPKAAIYWSCLPIGSPRASILI